MPIFLTTIEARVLGALVEKETTTPEYYPLSLNALVNACNQKNNREPVMQLDEDAVRLALHRIEDQNLAGATRNADSRVAKYEHRLQEVFNFTRGETAVMCVLLLRGPQTPGELRSRTERINRFEELDDVLSVLNRLMQREPSLVKALPRQPGTKEIRYMHLLSGDVEFSTDRAQVVPMERISERAASGPAAAERLQQLESEVAGLRHDVVELKHQIESILRSQP